MKRQTQKTGVRTYFGDDLVDLQTQPLNAIDAMLAAAGQCVISGCEVTPQGDKFDIAPGYVALEATDQATGAVRIMAMPFAGVSGVTLPVYLMASVDVVERAYGDGAVKPIAYAYNATASAVKPVQNTSIEITAGYTRGLSDALAESLAKYIAVTATEKAVWNAKETPAGAQAKADAAKTAAVATAKTYTDSAVDGKANANHSHGVATAAADGFMAKGDKSKLDGVATGANNYAHPADANTRHVTDAEKATWNGKSNASHNHGIATAAADGFMAKGDKAKLDGVATGANNYTHPADANTRHVTDAEKATWNGKVTATANNGMRCTKEGGPSSLYESTSTEIKPGGVDFETSLLSIGGIQGHIGRDGITLPSSAVIDMPCVALAGYDVLSTDSINHRFGAKRDTYNDVTRPSGTTGVYTVPHKIGHTRYNIAVTVKAVEGTRFYGWNEIYGSRTDSSVQIKICEMQVGAANVGFSITFFGTN